MLLFDIETLARPEAVSKLPLPEAPSTYKDPVKIAEYIERKRAEQLADAALDPDTARVACISWRDVEKRDDAIEVHIAASDEGVPPQLPSGVQVTLYPAEGKEDELLLRFWNKFAEHHGCCSGYNILGFDLPFLLRRSFALGVRPTVLPRLARYQNEPTRDLYSLLYNWQPGKGLKTVCELYGIENPLAQFNGGDYSRMSLQSQIEYAANDVRLTRDLYLQMSGIYWACSDPEFPF